MKKLTCIALCTVLGSLALTAADQFIVKFRGTIITPEGRTRVKETDLVRTNGNTLVLVVDTIAVSGNFLRFYEADSTGTNILVEQVQNYGKVYNHRNRKLVADLYDGDNKFEN